MIDNMADDPYNLMTQISNGSLFNHFFKLNYMVINYAYGVITSIKAITWVLEFSPLEFKFWLCHWLLEWPCALLLEITETQCSCMYNGIKILAPSVSMRISCHTMSKALNTVPGTQCSINGIYSDSSTSIDAWNPWIVNNYHKIEITCERNCVEFCFLLYILNSFLFLIF